MLPEYYVLKEKLINLIESGQPPDNHLAPSERELIEKYNISRITARRAIEELVRENYLYKIQGKGTYVIKPDS